MQKNLILSNAGFPYEVKSRRGARGIRISVGGDGEVVVTKPRYVPVIVASKVVEGKATWVLEQIEKIKNKPKKILAHYGMKDFKEKKAGAYKLVESRVEYFNKFYGFDVKSIKIRNQKTRWGSCSRTGNLNFNFKILFLPEHLCDYIIVHELCHLAEMNHSKAFWSLVGEQVPDYKARRQNIKLY